MRLFGLIGFPLTHSFSKKFFDEKFRKDNLHDCRYENFQLSSIEEFPRLLKDHPELEGLNVTIPYKESVLQFLDEANELVRQISASNCIKIIDGRVTGYNTDAIGFERSLLKRLQAHHTNALVLGTGGAAKAIEFVLKKLNIRYKKVSRNPKPGDLSYDQLTSSIVDSHELIINTTPVGMFPKLDQAPAIPYDAITGRHFLFDLTYNPEMTLFLRRGEEKGALIQNGYELLVYQAQESWKIWNS
jgi:shikimate dehydrogenase